MFGNVAVAVAGCEITENDASVNRGVEMMILVKDAGTRRIAAQAWDTERDGQRLPADTRPDHGQFDTVMQADVAD